jgi:hypothetical protein
MRRPSSRDENSVHRPVLNELAGRSIVVIASDLVTPGDMQGYVAAWHRAKNVSFPSAN